jgi:hypothetical protein
LKIIEKIIINHTNIHIYLCLHIHIVFALCYK